jgi:hypothetical protein
VASFSTVVAGGLSSVIPAKHTANGVDWKSFAIISPYYQSILGILLVLAE